jgi:hypothetical protein
MKLAGRVATGLSLLLLAAGAACARPLFGFTPFPYDATPQAVARTQEILREGATIHAIHMDDGIPWDELLDGRAIPKRVQKEWDDLARAVPAGRPVYLGLAPLAKDRKSLVQGKGEKDFLALPWSLKLAALDDDKVKSAYLEYARRAVAQFKPAYLNLGIEAGELASRDPKRWPQFEALYRHVASALKREHPQLKIGISFGLQGLRKPETAQRVRSLVEASDYIGLSFYPHASPFGERFGEPALGEGPQAWREPLEWVRAFTKKPIAICETGYLTNPVTVKSFNLQLKGDIDLQTQYVRELAQFAERDDYLFVVWFLAVDYDRLFERMGGATASNDVNLLWRNIGLWTGDVKPKPAWEEWKRAVAGRSEGAPPRSAPAVVAVDQAAVIAAAPATRTAPESAAIRSNTAEVGFTTERQLFQTSPNGEASLEPEAGMRWSYAYKKDEWSWAARDLGLTLPATTQRLKLRLRSDRPGALFVQLEETGGETFFALVNPSKDWTDVTLELASLKPDPAKRKDGVLQPERIIKLLVADPAGRDKVDGRRSVWISRWSFD